ncbi:MAG: chemotaxis protein CheB [Telmatospirillum sp.]|nr:chemotaxis protein CheB [Telmatospirillum sp.]
MRCEAVVMGGSAGGFAALSVILAGVPASFTPPVLIVQHLHAEDGGMFAEHLAAVSPLPVVEACDKMSVAGGRVHLAPANYHLLAEDRTTLSLSVDPPVNHSRPSIDVLFESAARVWGGALVAVLTSGASSDGTAGLKAIKAAGGYTIVQDPASADCVAMPVAAIAAGVADEILVPARIAGRLLCLSGG